MQSTRLVDQIYSKQLDLEKKKKFMFNFCIFYQIRLSYNNRPRFH